MPEPLTIAIDFDGTWSADPPLWLLFATNARLRGHEVIIATGRTQWSEDMGRALLRETDPIVYCRGELKEDACKAAGHHVHIWIDDMPGMIQRCLILGGTL